MFSEAEHNAAICVEASPGTSGDGSDVCIPRGDVWEGAVERGLQSAYTCHVLHVSYLVVKKNGIS